MIALSAAVAGVALTAGSALSSAMIDAGAPSAASDPCARSRDLHVGPTAGPYFSTVSPFEHFASDRRQVFPFTCTLREIAGGDPIKIDAREAPGSYATPYIPVTRGRNQLYVYGYGANPQTDGAFVARVDPVTLHERWRTLINLPPPGQWSYPGVLLAHGNGYLYAIYGNVLVKLDPVTGLTLARRVLPENPKESGAAYNGMVVLPDGRIVAKGIERGPCSIPGTFGGLECSSPEPAADAGRRRRPRSTEDPHAHHVGATDHRPHHIGSARPQRVCVFRSAQHACSLSLRPQRRKLDA